MRKRFRWLWMAFLGILCVLILFSCQKASEQSKSEEEPDTASDPVVEEEKPMLLDREQAYVVAENKATEYVLVRDDQASEEVKQKISSFRNRFWLKTGADIRVEDDTSSPASKEILIALMDGRAEPEQELAKLSAPQQKGYRISTVGEKIVVATTEEYLSEALELLERAICDCGDSVWGVPKTYLGALDLPVIDQAGSLYPVGQGNYAYNVPNVSSKTVNDFIDRLEEQNYTKYDSHTVGESDFWTYIKDSMEGNMVIYVMYHKELQTLRVTYGPMEYLPNVTPIEESFITTPTVTQMYMQMADNGFGKDNIANNTTGAPGMSYLLQLSDGRFIMIDGGNADGTVTPAKQNANGLWTIGSAITTKDEKRLYDTMCDMLPPDETKPTIAVWFISHAHGDHMLLATDFVETYKDQIELEMIAFNFLEVSQTKLWIGMKDWEMNFRNRVATNFPDAETWIMHTGQRLFLPGCEIEVLATAEDTVCTGKTISDGNDICAVYRIKLGNSTFLVLGDAYPTTTEFMRDAYGSALESDILQLAHHGFEGSGMVKNFYSLVDPKICFWPCDEFRFQMDNRTIGHSDPGSTFYMNWWLRNTSWTRENRLGARQHYTASYMTTIDASTGKKIS